MIDIKQIIFKDFTVDQNYSYIELLEFLNVYKKEFVTVMNNKNSLIVENKELRKIIEKLEHEIERLNNKISDEEKKIMYLTSQVSKKLSIFERITGKIKI